MVWPLLIGGGLGVLGGLLSGRKTEVERKLSPIEEALLQQQYQQQELYTELFKSQIMPYMQQMYMGQREIYPQQLGLERGRLAGAGRAQPLYQRLHEQMGSEALALGQGQSGIGQNRAIARARQRMIEAGFSPERADIAIRNSKALGGR